MTLGKTISAAAAAAWLALLLSPLVVDLGVLLVATALAAYLVRYGLELPEGPGALSGSLPKLLACALLLWGSQLSASGHSMQMGTTLIFALAAGLAVLPDPRPRERPHPSLGIPLLIALSLAGAASIVLARLWLVQSFGAKVYDHFGVFLFFMPRSVGSYENIPTRPFEEWPLLLYPLAFLSAALWLIPRLEAHGRRPAALGLFALSFSGKFFISILAFGGLDSLASQILAISTHYYEMASKITSPGDMLVYIRDFNLIQAHLSTHGNSHPFGPQLFYFAIQHAIAPGPFVAALAVMLLSSLSAIGILGLAEASGLGRRTAIAAAALYALAPPNLILASSGIDCIIGTLFIFGLWAWQRSRATGSQRAAAVAGLIAFAASLFTLAFSYLCLLFALLELAAPRPSWLRRLALAAALVLGLHLLLWAGTGGSFHYLEVYAVAAMAHHMLPHERPYFLWVWGNPLLFLGYAGMGSAMAYGWRACFERRQAEALFSVGLFVLVAIMLQGLGVIEIQRIYLWAYAFLFIGAAPLFEGRPGLYRTALALNFASAVVLELSVLDYW